jgi:hypothetical protein
MCAAKRSSESPPIGALVEVRGLSDRSPTALQDFAARLALSGCTVDFDYPPVPMDGGATHVIRCLVADERVIERLRERHDVVFAAREGRAEPF